MANEREFGETNGTRLLLENERSLREIEIIWARLGVIHICIMMRYRLM